MIIWPSLISDQPKTNRYFVQTRSQAKSSGIKILEIHGANKGLDPHVEPGKQRPLPSLPIQCVVKGLPMHPIPKPELVKVEPDREERSKHINQYHYPISHPVQPITKHVQKTVMPLPETTVQSQIDVLPQPISILFPQ